MQVNKFTFKLYHNYFVLLTLYTCRLFLLTRTFQYISNWLKVFEHLPTLFLQYTQSHNFSNLYQINNSSVDYAGLYLNWANTSLLIISGTLPTLKLPIKSYPSSRCNFSIELQWLQRRSNKVSTILYDRYYLQNCKAITFAKIANRTKYEKPNVSSRLHIF